jgi:hypothetical protein
MKGGRTTNDEAADNDGVRHNAKMIVGEIEDREGELNVSQTPFAFNERMKSILNCVRRTKKYYYFQREEKSI